MQNQNLNPNLSNFKLHDLPVVSHSAVVERAALKPTEELSYKSYKILSLRFKLSYSNSVMKKGVLNKNTM